MTTTPSLMGTPTFLVGSERSGTTLLRLMLDSHPELAFRSEFDFAVEIMHSADRWPDLAAYYEYIASCRFVNDRPEIDRSLDYPALVRSFLEQKRVQDGKPRVGAVVHKHFDRLLRIWPDARFIHLLRDGRDVADSCVGMGWYGNVWSAAERWLEAERLWDQMIDLVPSERRLEVRYEELVSAPEATLARICAFIGMPYDSAMLDYPNHSTYESPQARYAYQWRRKLEPRAVRLIEARAGAMLVRRGYAPSGLPHLAMNALAEAFQRMGNRFGIMRARLSKLGPRLWLENAIVSRLGTEAWRNSVRLRIHAATNAAID